MEPPPHKEPFHLNLQKDGQGMDVMDSSHQSTFFSHHIFACHCNESLCAIISTCAPGMTQTKAAGLARALERCRCILHGKNFNSIALSSLPSIPCWQFIKKKNYYCKHLWKPVMAPHTATLPYMAMFTSTAWKIINAVTCWLSTIMCLSHSFKRLPI